MEKFLGTSAGRSWNGENRCQGPVFEGFWSLVPFFLVFSCLPVNTSPSHHMIPKCSTQSHGIEKPRREECDDNLFML